MPSTKRSGFGTLDEVLAWICYGDEDLVNRVAPQPDRLTFQQLRFRRVRSYPDPSPELREWLNMRVGGNPSYQFLRLPRPEEIGTPRDLYAACKSGEVIAWGRDRSGEMKPIPVAEWAEEAPRKAWVEFRFNWKDINRVFSGIGSDNIAGDGAVSARDNAPMAAISSELHNDRRVKAKHMICGLEKAFAKDRLKSSMLLKAAHREMLAALGHKTTPRGMGIDAFAKHCRAWLKEKGIFP